MMNWKKPVIYCISFVCCFFAFIAIDLACADEGDPYDYYTSFFHSNLQGQKEYGSFYFTNNLFLYSENEPVNESEINAGEWADYLGKGVTTADVAKAMYHLSPAADSVLYSGYLSQKSNLPDSLAGNTFLKNIITSKSALKYYRFVKNAEKVANFTYNSWDPKPIDSVALRAQGVVAFNAGLQEKDKFIQLRYYYQAQRLLHYGHSYSQASVVYNKYIAASPSQSRVKGWALALKAGEERKLGNELHSAYLFSKIFALYPERRVQAYHNFMYMSVKPDQVLALATNNDERATIYAIAGFSDPTLNIEPLKHIYQISPGSPVVGVLLIREINKLEEYYLTGKLHTPGFNNTPGAYPNTQTKELQAVNDINQLKDFCKQLAADQKYPEPQLGTLAAAYLAWMQGNTDEGSTLLKTLYGIKLSDKLEDEKQIVQLLLSAQTIQKYDRINEASLLPALKWLDDKVATEGKADEMHQWNEDGSHPFAATRRNFYQQILAPAYLKQHDTTMTALALAKGDDAWDYWENELHSDNIRTIIRLRSATSATPYVMYLANRADKHTIAGLYELLGTTYLREHQYAKAAAIFKRPDIIALKGDDSYTPADPFIELINDYPKVYIYSKAKGYTKLQFAEAMATLQQQIKTDPANAASYYYKIATGLYNTSNYGNAWYLISYNWSSTDFGRTDRYYYDADYVRTTNAEEYFNLAFKYSKTPEFKAKCIFMAAKCRQKEAVSPDYSTTNFDEMQKAYLKQLRGNDYFTQLKADYKHTEFYKKAVGACTYLKDFM